MKKLNEKEEEIMNILWKLNKAFAKEVINEIDEPKPPYNTVLSMIRKLEKEGYVNHNLIGKSHQYFPEISKKSYKKSMMKYLLKSYFEGSHEKLLSFFMKEEKLSKEEVERVLNKYKEN